MSGQSPLISGLPTRDHAITDFDLVDLDGRLILVGSPGHDRLACAWDPAVDRWSLHELDVADERFPRTDLAALGAAVVDGRIVIGGGGDHQGFAMWDLMSGAVRVSAQDSCPSSVVRADFGDSSRLLVGFANAWGVQLWDPAMTDDGDDLAEDDIEELECRSGTSSAAAAGLLAGRPVVVAGGRDGGVLVWDVEEQRAFAEFDDLDDVEPTEFALVPVDGRIQVVAAGGRSLVLADPESGERGEPLTVPGDDISCLTTGIVRGRPLAVTGARDGTIGVWDLTERRLLGRPFRGSGGEVFGLRVADLAGRSVIVSGANGDSVHLWEVPS